MSAWPLILIPTAVGLICGFILGVKHERKRWTFRGTRKVEL